MKSFLFVGFRYTVWSNVLFLRMHKMSKTGSLPFSSSSSVNWIAGSTALKWEAPGRSARDRILLICMYLFTIAIIIAASNLVREGKRGFYGGGGEQFPFSNPPANMRCIWVRVLHDCMWTIWAGEFILRTIIHLMCSNIRIDCCVRMFKRDGLQVGLNLFFSVPNNFMAAICDITFSLRIIL